MRWWDNRKWSGHHVPDHWGVTALGGDASADSMQDGRKKTQPEAGSGCVL